MSVKVKVSYETDEELAFVREKLAERTHRVELEPRKGRYKRAYLTLKNIVRNGAKSG
jgi:hypothetical protein